MYVHMDDSRKKILGAFLVGSVLVVFALVVKLNQPLPEETSDGLTVIAATTPRSHIEISDKDNDGIPDWQEALQKAEPIILEEVKENYEPETATEEFSIEFLQNMVLSSNYGEFGAKPEEIAGQAAEQMSELAVDKLYGSNDIQTDNNNTPEAVRHYANQLAQIVMDNTVPANSLNELEILKQAYTTENPSRLDELDPIIAMYKDMVDRSLKVTVPSDYAKEHLDLINVYNAIYQDILAMKLAFVDPIKTVVRLKRYDEDATSLFVVLLNLQKKMLLNDVTFTESDPAYRFLVRP